MRRCFPLRPVYRNALALSFLVLAFFFASDVRCSANLLAQLKNSPGAAYLHQIWRSEEGLPDPVVKAVIQSKNGYLWLGTDDGLSSFDGVRFTVYERSTTSEKSDRWIVGLIEAKDGSIWTSSINGGLSHLQNGKLTRYTTKDGLLNNYVLSLCEDSQRNLWIGTAKGLSCFRNGKFINYTNEPGLIVEAVRSLLEDREGRLWIGTAKGLSLLKDGKFSTHTTDDLLVHNAVMTLHEDRDGSIWIGTSGGLTHLVNGKPQHFTTAHGLAHNTIRALLEDHAGHFWVGTQGGIQLFENGNFSPVKLHEETVPDFEGIAFVYALFQDREDNIWVGNNIGLSRLKMRKFRVYSKQEGLPNNATTLVYGDKEKTVWIGTYGGGLCRLYPDERMLVLTTSNGLSSDYILSLCEDRHGAFWVGTDGGGLNRLGQNGFQQFKIESDLSANAIRVIHEDKNGDLWIGSNAGAYRFKNGKAVKEEKIPRSTIRAIIEDRRGNLWFCTKNGLARWHNGVVKNFGHSAGLPNESVATVFEDSSGEIWTATDNGGIHRINADGRFSPSPRHFYERVLHIIEDDQKRFWLSTRNGIFSATKKQLDDAASGINPSVDFTVYDRKDGLRRAQCNGIAQPAGWKCDDGYIWFPTLHGAAAFHPEQIFSNHVPPPIVIEDISIDGRRVDLSGSSQMPPGNGKVEIQYTALSLQAPERVKFQYKLEGFDTQWQEVGGRRSAQYASLPPGDYHFVVKACNNDGVWNEAGASFAFTLAPHFYQTPQFYALCFLIIVGAAFGLHRLRIMQLKARELELAELVEKRTGKLQELVKSMESFNYSIAHDLRAPIRAIRGLTQALIEDYKASFDDLGCDYAKRIVQSVDRMDELIEDLLTYGQISHKDIPLGRIQTDELLNKVLQMLAADIASKKAVVQITKPLPAVWANETVLEQVFLNLIGNALKFVPPGVAPCIQIWAEEKGSQVKFFVKDNGIGILPQHQERIFRIFERLHPGEIYPGTGIGLAIVHRGIERVGGKVGVTSEVGKGSCFWVELPKA